MQSKIQDWDIIKYWDMGKGMFRLNDLMGNPHSEWKVRSGRIEDEIKIARKK